MNSGVLFRASPNGYVCATFNELLDAGWRMMDIDNMDVLGFLRLRAWRAHRERQNVTPRRRFIDEVWAEQPR